MEKEHRREDLGEGYMVIEEDKYYSILTPTSSIILPKDKFRRMISRFAHELRREPRE